MGIPLFTKTITRKYPHIIEQNKPKCSRLFLDLNCAIHQCTNNILANAAHYADTQDELVERDIVHHTIDYIYKIVAYTQPTDLIYIAIDGLPPVAKMSQQRKRRFVSSWRQASINARLKDTKHNFVDWDRNAITPGTKFMDYLNKALHDHFMVEAKNDNRFACPIVLTDSNEPGEGEAKILDHIKETPLPTDNDIIYGLDADLIMLGLLSSKNNIFLLREPAQYDMKIAKPFLFLDINLLRKYISVEFSPAGENHEYDENIVWDYVALCFLVGNDFLPPLSFLKIRHNGIEMIMQAYQDTKDLIKQNLVMSAAPNGPKQLNYLFLQKVLEKLKGVEDGCMCEAEDNYYSRKLMPMPGKKSLHDRIAFEIDNYPTINKFPKKIQPQKPGWRLNYYNYLFNITDIEDINGVCLNYMEGIEWTFNYYFNQCISRDWHYRYSYSPTILDLHNYLMMTLQDAGTLYQKSINENNPAIDYTTDMQLLLVLPPSSSNLLKPDLRVVMTDISHGCCHLYPQTFGITTYLKNYLWEASPVLPPIETETIANKTKEILNKSKIKL